MKKVQRKDKIKKTEVSASPLKQKPQNISASLPLWKTGLIALFIVVITFFAFRPALDNGFTNWDDPGYLTENPSVWGLQKQNLKAIFSDFFMSNYHPLTMLSLAYDYSKAKLTPERYHRVNLVLHLINTLLVFIFIFLLSHRKILPAALTALIFGIHPMHVESVAWVAARKDVLFSLFFLSGLVLYIIYLQTQSFVKSAPLYLIILILSIASMLSKPAAVTFPVVLLLIDYFKERKLNWKVFAEKAPFFIAAVIFGIINIKAQSQQSISDWSTMEVHHRIMFASFGFFNYIYKFFIPTGLSAFHPYPTQFPITEALPFYYYVLPFLAIGLVYVVYRTLSCSRLYAFGFLFYLVNVALVLQFISVGSALTAERYTYIPYIGIAFTGSMLLDRFFASKRHSNLKPIVVVLLSAFIILLAILCYQRTQVWKDNITLWTDVIEKYPGKVETAYKNRGNHYARETKQYDLALKDYEAYIKIKPNDASIYSNRGNLYGLMRKFEESLADYTTAIKLDSNYVDAYLNRAVTLMNMNRPQDAINDIDKALKKAPDKIAGYRNRALCYINLKRYSEAIADYSFLIEKEPYEKNNYFYRGIAYFNSGNYEQAAADFTKTIEMDNSNAQAYLNRSQSYKASGKMKEALEDALTAKKLGAKVADEYINSLK